MRAFLRQEVVPEQVAAFMLGWRVKKGGHRRVAGALEVSDEFVSQARPDA